MALPTSGAISLNEIHVEAGGTTGTTASINDEDIRGLIDKTSGATMSFSEWYGASATVDITYYVVGAGGGGGGAGNTAASGSGADGTSTSISSSAFTTVTAAGGGGGGGGFRVTDTSGDKTQRDGGIGVTIGGVERGAGGDGGYNLGGGDDTEYGGAGGGGAGGAGEDSISPTGNGGSQAGYETGTLSSIAVGTVITVTIGTGGTGGTGYVATGNGYAGSDGFVRLSIGGTNYDFTSSGSHTVA